MSFLRSRRRSIGLLVAALLVAAGGLPGAGAAFEGPQVAFPICSPDGPKGPVKGPPSPDCVLHCQLLSSSEPLKSAAAIPEAVLWPTPDRSADRPVGTIGVWPETRAELWPLTERGPPVA